jgi:glutamate synthase domain-containing protein 1
VIRKRMEHAVDALDLPGRESFYVVSLSSRTLIYKGMLTANQIQGMFPDLADTALEGGKGAEHGAMPIGVTDFDDRGRRV